MNAPADTRKIRLYQAARDWGLTPARAAAALDHLEIPSHFIEFDSEEMSSLQTSVTEAVEAVERASEAASAETPVQAEAQAPPPPVPQADVPAKAASAPPVEALPVDSPPAESEPTSSPPAEASESAETSGAEAPTPSGKRKRKRTRRRKRKPEESQPAERTSPYRATGPKFTPAEITPDLAPAAETSSVPSFGRPKPQATPSAGPAVSEPTPVAKPVVSAPPPAVSPEGSAPQPVVPQPGVLQPSAAKDLQETAPTEGPRPFPIGTVLFLVAAAAAILALVAILKP